jgi:tripartite-type tricarboxylate transporter receptor subunit TctC
MPFAMKRAHEPTSIVCRRKFAGGIAAVSALGLLAPEPFANAQAKYPTRSPRLVLPFAAGGVADVTARIVAEKLGDVLGHRFVVDNQPGAGGINAANTVRSARPDGYTLALLSNGTAVSVGLFNQLPFDPVKDFAPISSMGYFDFLFCVNASSPFQSMADLVKTAREKPGTLNIGTINIGSSQNLTAELLKLTAGIDVTLVPYRGSPEVLIALMRDDIQLAVDSYAALKSPIRDKRIRPIATSGASRSVILPDVPPAKESIGEFDVISWNAVFARAGTPKDIIDTLNGALHKVLALPEVKEKALEFGIEAKASTPEEIGERLRGDIDKWKKVIGRAGVPKQ